MIEPDKPPTDVESVASHPPVKTQAHDDFVFLQRCFKDALCGEIENWPVETFRLYFVTMRRFNDLLGLGLDVPTSSLKLTYGERFARIAILELSRKISASGKARDLMHQITGRKH